MAAAAGARILQQGMAESGATSVQGARSSIPVLHGGSVAESKNMPVPSVRVSGSIRYHRGKHEFLGCMMMTAKHLSRKFRYITPADLPKSPCITQSAFSQALESQVQVFPKRRRRAAKPPPSAGCRPADLRSLPWVCRSGNRARTPSKGPPTVALCRRHGSEGFECRGGALAGAHCSTAEYKYRHDSLPHARQPARTLGPSRKAAKSDPKPSDWPCWRVERATP
jgi:hypothetical protein